ncbi:MAG: HU family DNA-binding protein [Bacteroidaceae bacterium]|nr:HU family DNA-binding protein [Bacteroidaceae bacterium]
MDKKLTTQALVEEFAANNKITLATADEFVHAFFSIIAESLAAGDSVKIKGWGTFKVAPMNDRESTDVNTGERIVIKGYNKVTFTPESALKELINKPFAQFEAVELNDEYDSSHELAENAIEEEQEESGVPEELPTEGEETIVSDLETDKNADIQKEGSKESIHIDSAHSDDEIAQKDIIAIEANDVETPLPSEEKEAKELAQPEFDNQSEPKETIKKTLTQEDLKDNPPEMVSYRKSNKAWRIWLPILLLLLIAAGIYLFTLRTGHPTSTKHKVKESDMIKVEKAEFDDSSINESSSKTNSAADKIYQVTVTSDSVANKPKDSISNSVPATPVQVNMSRPGALEVQRAAEKAIEKNKDTANEVSSVVKNNGKPYKLTLTTADAAKNLKDFTAADTTNYSIDGTLAVHELKDGETIIRLAQVYYGDKKLWPYIVKYNWMKDPNHVSKGTVLNIPFLKPKK